MVPRPARDPRCRRPTVAEAEKLAQVTRTKAERSLRCGRGQDGNLDVIDFLAHRGLERFDSPIDFGHAQAGVEPQSDFHERGVTGAAAADTVQVRIGVCMPGQAATHGLLYLGPRRPIKQVRKRRIQHLEGYGGAVDGDEGRAERISDLVYGLDEATVKPMTMTTEANSLVRRSSNCACMRTESPWAAARPIPSSASRLT